MSRIVFDQYAHVDSYIHRLDPRSKLAGLLLPVLLISSTPRGTLDPFPFYFALTVCLVAVSRIPAAHILWRCVVSAPFIGMASGLLLLAGTPDAPRHALSVAFKAFSAIILMTLLTATCRFHQLLWAMRRLGAPQVLNLIVTLMHRYSILLVEQYQRMVKARESRCARSNLGGNIGLFGRQFGMLFLRSWDRSERVHAAMLSRGFTGNSPDSGTSTLRAADFCFPLLSTGLFALARWGA